MDTSVLSLLRCPSCFTGDLTPETGLRPRLRCGDCGAAFAVQRGIPDLVRPGATIEGVKPKVSRFFNLVSRLKLYDTFTPLISLAIWRCSPLEYVSMAHRAIGAGRQGSLLEAGIGTGAHLAYLADYVRHVPTVVGVDISWEMLRLARKRLDRAGLRHVTLIRADVEALPFRDAVFHSVLCANSLHSFPDRTQALKEMYRTLRPGGRMVGSTLVRGMHVVGDRVLDLYQTSGLFERLVSKEYMLADLRHLGLQRFTHHTRGSLLFFDGYRSTTADGMARPSDGTAAEEVGKGAGGLPDSGPLRWVSQ